MEEILAGMHLKMMVDPFNKTIVEVIITMMVDVVDTNRTTTVIRSVEIKAEKVAFKSIIVGTIGLNTITQKEDILKLQRITGQFLYPKMRDLKSNIFLKSLILNYGSGPNEQFL
jgi:hypothetical protein